MPVALHPNATRSKQPINSVNESHQGHATTAKPASRVAAAATIPPETYGRKPSVTWERQSDVTNYASSTRYAAALNVGIVADAHAVGEPAALVGPLVDAFQAKCELMGAGGTAMGRCRCHLYRLHC